MECRYKKFFAKSRYADTGECELTYPSCLKELPYGICGYMEKYDDLAMDARMITKEFDNEDD